MERITITIDDELLAGIDAMCARRGYDSRSEALRDVLRRELARERLGEAGHAPAHATLSYIYNHHVRELASRLTTNHHDHHALSVATTHVHVDDDNCLEVSILKGPADSLRAFADGVISQRGVKHGHLHLIPAEASGEAHEHPHHHGHGHDEA